ncbi:MAG: hypothetical protein C5B49_14520 [Bdellovibrio sp.]|nr:MAG: hypothetical protein C5B49_14520 [Bdellovibrio sp.]
MIFILMCSSIICAAIYHAWDLSKHHEKFWHSSATKIELNADEADESVEHDCPSSRLYLEPFLSSLPPMFREDRWHRAHDFSRDCARLTLLHAEEFGHTNRLAFCQAGRGMVAVDRPCATEKLINVYANALGDIADCYDLSAREFLSLALVHGLLSPAREWERSLPKDVSLQVVGERSSCQRLRALAGWNLNPPVASAEVPTEPPRAAELVRPPTWAAPPTQSPDSLCPLNANPLARLIDFAAEVSLSHRKIEQEFQSVMNSSEARNDFSERGRLNLRFWGLLMSQELGFHKAVTLLRDAVTANPVPVAASPPTPARRQVASVGGAHHGEGRGEGRDEAALDFLNFLQNRLDHETFARISVLHGWLDLLDRKSLRATCAPESLQ